MKRLSETVNESEISALFAWFRSKTNSEVVEDTLRMYFSQNQCKIKVPRKQAQRGSSIWLC